MSGYIGTKASVTQVDGYNRTEADDRYVNAAGDTVTGSLTLETGRTYFGKDGGDATWFATADLLSEPNNLAYGFASDGSTITLHRFYTNGTQRMLIDSSGRLLVGTTGVPNVGAGQTGFSVSSTEMVFSSNTNGSNALSYWRTQSGNSYVASYWNGNSNVGSIFVTTTSTLYNTSSDYRLKEDVQPMVGASDRVLALNPVNFAWKVNGERVDGFLAHEAQAVVPEAVTGEKDAVDDEGNPKYQGIDQSKLVPLLTAALQEALTKIDALETRIAALEGN